MYKSINYQIMFIKKSNMLTIVTGNYNNLKQMLPDDELSQKRKAGNDDYDNLFAILHLITIFLVEINGHLHC